ncbi:alpha/beta hydrolase [Novosphingobium sp.]|uniref:alpha/beta hydrolase n=1 Tax=Novosphingobium sp. TaxID=1874826 RepID=UPI0025D8E380|nr:alpha/beta hydrolase [Novosphingobium sp.]MCC6927238.1 alpha/beta hydrolase [Novosphingobium sp.]
MGWVLIGLAVLALAGFGVWRWALANNAVALLDWGDRQFGGNSGYALTLADGRYGPLAEQKIEVLVPDTPAERPRPVVVFIHGGGWHSGTPGDYRFVGRTLAREGYVVVLVGYRLGPDGRYPAMLEDSALALAWTHDTIARYGGDPARVVVMGHSAGAYNAVMLALERQWLGRVGVPDGFIKGVIGLSGPYDFHPFTSDSARNAFGHVPDPALTQPIHFVRGDAPHMLLITGDADTTVKPINSDALARALSAAGAPTRPIVLEGVDHSGTVMKLAAPFSRDRRVLDPVLKFLAAQCRPSATVQPAP